MIDWSKVVELRNDVGAEDFADVVELFLEEVSEAIAGLAPDAGPDAPEPLAAKLHFLKGSALSLGFRAFSGLCEEGEKLCREGRGSEVDLQAIRDVYDRSRAEFIAQLPQRLAA